MRVARIALHLAIIAIVMVAVWLGVTRLHYGPVLMVFSDDRGVHRGDVPIVSIGGILLTVAVVSLLHPPSDDA